MGSRVRGIEKKHVCRNPLQCQQPKISTSIMLLCYVASSKLSNLTASCKNLGTPRKLVRAPLFVQIIVFECASDLHNDTFCGGYLVLTTGILPSLEKKAPFGS